jgi:hypothetical protein
MMKAKVKRYISGTLFVWTAFMLSYVFAHIVAYGQFEASEPIIWAAWFELFTSLTALALALKYVFSED